MRESFMMSSAFAVVAAAQAIGHVGQAIFVETAGHQHRGDGAEHRRHGRGQRVGRQGPVQAA